ncbi:hypothetical protein BGZ60DRAFT_363362 [Tricladium varicosporioides]|nr:hypothetical protein BGZ60DRAFT_363362 [Hymenoscyphus varicosporioides]
MSAPTQIQIAYAYRHLYRGLLKAVQYSKPARYTALDQLRKSFRNEDPATFDQVKINTTLEFLTGAARETGLEHKILRNLLLVKYWQKHQSLPRDWRGTAKDMKNTALVNYELTLAMLNKSLGLCLR